MGLLYAVLLACISTAHCGRFRWTTEMIIKNPENNPFLNDAALGPLQYLWKSLGMSSDETYHLMFRTKQLHDHYIKCVSLRAKITDPENKTATCAMNYYNDTSKTFWNATMWMRFFVQNDYTIENVIRGSFNEPPKAHTIPQGSNNYIRYNDDDCDPSSIPFQEANGEDYEDEDYLELWEPQLVLFGGQVRTDIDFYVVYNEPECNVLRIDKECDLWLRSNELQVILEAAVREAETNAPEEEEDAVKKLAAKESITTTEETITKRELKGENTAEGGATTECISTTDREAEEETNRLKRLAGSFERRVIDAIFRQLPAGCRFAFLSSCGYPEWTVYDRKICNETQGMEGQGTNS
ncbi:uncharacterized protein LOC8042055 [Ixodes scapularis]|uniref:uncharacterized protein LOC8042055 n=1 Tax=Ixodes scapularis TaxID=6945 RepID=UPI001A9E2B12|nr:uncharacterized protein LOC8042055 [Ixodes scapularis]